MSQFSLKNFWKLPKPTSLGFSSDCAMGMRDFGLQPGQECWEDYYELCEKKYPVRYFLNEKMGTAVRRFLGRIKDFQYELKYLFLPSHQYHRLSLSQPFGYNRGWVDADQQIVYANFNILVDFVENESGGLSELEADLQRYLDPWGEEFGGPMIEHAKATKELIEIYSYWKWERLPFYQYEKYRERLSYKEEEDATQRETEMLMRLMKIRQYMWT